jgi:hypothetical protein
VICCPVVILGKKSLSVNTFLFAGLEQPVTSVPHNKKKITLFNAPPDDILQLIDIGFTVLAPMIDEIAFGFRKDTFFFITQERLFRYPQHLRHFLRSKKPNFIHVRKFYL